MSSSAASILTDLIRTTLLLAGIGIAAALLLRVVRVQSPRLHRLAWCVTLLAGWTFVRLPVGVPWHAAEVAEPRPIAATPVEPLEPVEIMPLDDFAAPVSGLPDERPLSPAEPQVSVPPPAEVSSAAPPALTHQATWQQVAVAAWAIGMASTEAWWLWAYLCFIWRLPRALPCESEWQEEWLNIQAEQGGDRRISLRVTKSLGPLLCRLPRGAELLVPRELWRNLSREERLAILRHELAHHQRGDVWKSLAMRVLALPHWFNPIAWLAVRRFDEAAEWACDRAAMGDEPTAYARMLLRLGELASTRAPLGSAMSNLPLTNRIRRLLTLETTEDSAMKKALLLSILLLVVPLASVHVRLVAQPPEAAQQPEASEQAAAVAPPTTASTASTESERVSSPYETPATVRKAELKMVESAKLAYEGTLSAYLAREAPIESVITWSNRWLNAELSVAATRDAQVAAARAHLARMQERQTAANELAKLQSRGGEAWAVAAANYYVADAERRLAEIEAKPETPGRSKTSISSPLPAPHAVRPQVIIAGTIYDLDDVALIPALRTVLQKRDDIPVLLEAIIATSSQFQLTDGSLVGKDYSSLAPELIELLDHPNADVREAAKRSLLSIRSRIGPELEKAAKSQNPEVAKVAKHLLSQTEPTDAPSRPSNPYQLLSRAPQRMDAPPALHQLDATKADLDKPTSDQGRELRYEGKTFDQWVNELRTELSPAKRKDAMKAMGEFAVNGFGPQAATAIFDAMQGYSVWAYEVSQDGVLKQVAVKAAMRVPAQQLAPIVAKALASDNKNRRIFALRVMPLDEETKDAMIPLLVAALGDRDRQIVELARPSLAVLDHDNPALIVSIRQALASDSYYDAHNALWIVGGGTRNDALSSIIQIRPYPELLPEALALLDHSNDAIRVSAYNSLASSAEPAYMEALETLVNGNGPQAANARKVLDLLQSRQPPKRGP